MDGIAELAQLSDSMRQAAALLADEDIDENSSSSSSRRQPTFLNVVALGTTGAGKSAVLNSLIGHPALPTGEGGATRAPICIDLTRDSSLSSKSIILQIDSKNQQVSASALRHSLQDRLSKSSGKSRDEICLKLRTSRAPPLKLIDLPGVDKGSFDDSLSEYVEHNDAILLVVIPASQAAEVSSYKGLRIAKEYDGESTRTIGVISKIDQAATEPKTLAAIQALLLGQGPRSTSDIPWVALIGQTVSISSAQSGNVWSENSLETAWKAESESLKSILTGAPQSKLGRLALVDTLVHQIRNRMKVRLPNLLSGLQGKSQILQDELVRLGEQMVHSAEGTRALALELCREFEDKFLQHITTGEGSGWKVVASFEGNFPNRIKQLPLDRHFDLNNVKRIVLEADGYQPYLISPEKGLRSLIKGVLELAKEPARLCVDEVHRVLVDIVSAAANGTRGLGRYPPFKREVVAIATAALEGFKSESKKMVVALVDMERAFVPPQHFIRLVQRRMDRQRRDDELKNRSSRKGPDAEQSILNRATSPQAGGQQTGGSLKSMKDKSGQDKDVQEASGLKTAGADYTLNYLHPHNQNQFPLLLSLSLSLKVDIKFLKINMAQRTEKEETEFKAVPETLTPCVNNCGVTGNPATNNMCQNCFNASTPASSSSAGGDRSPRSRSTPSRSPERSFTPAEAVRIPTAQDREPVPNGSLAAVAKREVNRCSGCRRKVGLTGFRCRCGDLFCGEHRYSDRHDCSYDYKAAGREAISRENPVVKAAKIVRV